MKTAFAKSSSQTNRRGAAIVWIIVLIVVVVVVVNLVDRAKDPLSSLPKNENPASSSEIYPWQEVSRLLVEDQQPDNSTYKDQPKIEETIYIQGSLDEVSGKTDLKLEISPEGYVMATYSADFDEGTDPKINYNMNGSFKGNIDTENTYFDEQDEDASKLFFIAKGRLTIIVLKYSSDGGKTGSRQAYITGWINPDFSAQGQIAVIIDKEKFKIYRWKGKHQKNGFMF